MTACSYLSKDIAPVPLERHTTVKGILLLRLLRAPPSTSSPQSTDPKALGNSSYLSPRTRPTTTQSFPRHLSCFAPSYMLPHLVKREAISLLFREMTMRCHGVSPLVTWLNSRCPSLSKPWTAWAVPLLGVPMESRENTQTEKQ